jgi:4-amino-4-deoxy-L-arabinose transferase-like glycosyltransferase
MNTILTRREWELFLIAVLSFILIYFSVQTKFLGEDEQNYYGTAKLIAQSGTYPIRDFFGSPLIFTPLVPFILSVFSFSFALTKVIIAIFGVLTLIVTYAFCEKYVKKGSGIIAVALLFSASLFIQYSMLVYLEIPLAFFSITSFYFLLGAKNLKGYALTGIIVGLGLLTKTSALLILATLFIYLLYKRKPKEGLVLAGVALLVLTPWLIRNQVAFGSPMYFTSFQQILSYFGVHSSASSVSEITQAAQPLILPIEIVDNLGILMTFFSIFGIIYSYYKRSEIGMLCGGFILIFLLAWYSGFIGIIDVRYFSLIFPELAILGAIGMSFLNDDVKKWKIPLIVVIIILGASIFFGFSQALVMSTTTRFGDNYVNVLKWAGTNSTSNGVIMTTFTGSCEFYSGLHCVWPVGDLKDLMTTNDPTVIQNILKKNNVSYILISQGLVSSSYISTGTNTIGVFSLHFVQTINQYPSEFRAVRESNDTIIYGEGLVLPNVIMYKVNYV